MVAMNQDSASARTAAQPHRRSNSCVSKTPYPRPNYVRTGHRFYSPNLHAWLSRDRIGDEYGNVYRFVAEEPNGNYDPLGMKGAPASAPTPPPGYSSPPFAWSSGGGLSTYSYFATNNTWYNVVEIDVQNGNVTTSYVHDASQTTGGGGSGGGTGTSPTPNPPTPKPQTPTVIPPSADKPWTLDKDKTPTDPEPTKCGDKWFCQCHYKDSSGVDAGVVPLEIDQSTLTQTNCRDKCPGKVTAK